MKKKFAALGSALKNDPDLEMLYGVMYGGMLLAVASTIFGGLHITLR